MKVTSQDLKNFYQTLSTSELLSLSVSGELTECAESVLNDELTTRDVTQETRLQYASQQLLDISSSTSSCVVHPFSPIVQWFPLKKMFMGILIILLGVSMVKAGMWWWRIALNVEVYGDLSTTEIRQITRLIRRTLVREQCERIIVGGFIEPRHILRLINEALSQKILYITKEADGMTKVMTGDILGPLCGSGRYYTLLKKEHRWIILKQGEWISGFPTQFVGIV